MTADAEREPPVARRRLWILIGLTLAAGAVASIFAGTEPSALESPDIAWHAIEHDYAGSLSPIVAGPGGFIRAANGFLASVDGKDWERFWLRPDNQSGDISLSATSTVHATRDRWLIEATSWARRTIWASDDGAHWQRHRLGRAFVEEVDRIVATHDGFYADSNEGSHFYWSTDAVTWQRAKVPADGDAAKLFKPLVSRSGVTFFQHDLDRYTVDLIHTQDGETWRQGTIGYGDDGTSDRLVITSVSEIDGKWIAAGHRNRRANGQVQTDSAIWLSTDGRSWEYAGAPQLLEENGSLAIPIHLGDLLVFPARQVRPNSDRVTAWWATRDGITWESVGRAVTVSGLETGGLGGTSLVGGMRNADGTYTIAFTKRARNDR